MYENLVAFDTETHRIQPGLLAPPIVCMAFAEKDSEPVLLLRNNGTLLLKQIMGRADKPVLVGANIAYDMGVLLASDTTLLPRVFRWYEEGRIYDIQIAQALDAIAHGHLFINPSTGETLKDPDTGKRGRYSLSSCVKLELGREDAKALDEYRQRYGELDGVPIIEWPREAIDYPREDAKNTLLVCLSQLARKASNLQSMQREVRASLALHLGSIWGIRTDSERVEAVAAKVEEQHAERVKTFTKVGYIRENGTEDQARLKRAVAAAYGASGSCPRCKGTGMVPSPTAVRRNDEREKLGKRRLKEPSVICKLSAGGCDGTGYDLSTVPHLPVNAKDGKVTSIKADRDTLQESGDDELSEYGDDEFEKIRTTYIPFLRKGVLYPINPRANILLETFRNSYDGAIQTLPREGPCRECFKARPGYVYCSCDYSGIELCTFAQTCIDLFGRSKLAEVLNQGRDVHSNMASQLMGISYEEGMRLKKLKDKVFTNLRQASKPINFGLPGGMGNAKTVAWARSKSNGSTLAPTGKNYSGIRFCILMGGQESCGRKKITEYKSRPTVPICRYCVDIVSEELRPTWLKLNPEAPEYFKVAGGIAKSTGSRVVVDTVRGGMKYTQCCNDPFQRRAAIGMKMALWEVTKECYLKELDSPLYGTRIPMAIHDELFSEMPEEKAHLAGPRMAQIMTETMRKVVPDVLVKVEPALMRYWVKGAEPVYRDTKLIPWEDR